MTKLDELWEEVETWLDGIANTVSHRCYQKRNIVGVRAIQRDVRKHLTWIDAVLLEIERQSAEAAKVDNGV